MVETKNLYPLSCLRRLKRDDRTRLVDYGIVLMKQMIEEDPPTLARKTGIPQRLLEGIRQQIELTSWTTV
jgi:hypothetical protein